MGHIMSSSYDFDYTVLIGDYRFVDLELTYSVSNQMDQYAANIDLAVTQWDRASGISFTKVDNGGDIHFITSLEPHAWYGYYAGNALIGGYAWKDVDETDMSIDRSYVAMTPAGLAHNVNRLLLHEIGHALGLNHVNDANPDLGGEYTVMSYMWPNMTLGHWDKLAIWDMYGRDQIIEGNDIGGAGNGDRIYGDHGDDLIYAYKGPDSVFGGVGDDLIYLGNGHDLVDGGNGNDTIVSGKGNDVLIGGGGEDVFVINGHGNKTIYDFNVNHGDRIANHTGEDFEWFLDGTTWKLINSVATITMRSYVPNTEDVIWSDESTDWLFA